MFNTWSRAAISVVATAFVTASTSVVVIALAGKPVRMAVTTPAVHILVEVNSKASVVPVYPDQNEQEVLIAYH